MKGTIKIFTCAKLWKKRLTTVGLTLISILILSSFIFSTGCTRKEKEIKIGAILPLTGSGAKYGEEAKRGIELALKDVKNLKIKIIYEDDQGTANGAVNAFKKLVESEKVPVIIGPMYSSTALAIAPLAQMKKVVVFSPSASSPELTKAGDYFFRNWPSDTYEGSEMAKFAHDILNLKTIAILSVNLDYGIGLTKVFKETFESLSGKVLTIEYYEQGATDFRTQLSKIKSLNPEAIYLPGYYSEIGLILRQAKEMGLKAKFLSCVGFDNPKVLEIAGGAAEGVIFARPYYNPHSQEPHVKHFVERFKSEFGVLPGIYAAHAYDALKIIVEAIKRGKYSAEGIKNALYSIKNFPGVSGNTSFDKNGDVIKPIQIMIVKKGEFIRYE